MSTIPKIKSYLTKSKNKKYLNKGTVTDIHMGNVLEILEPPTINFLTHIYEEKGKDRHRNSAPYLHDDGYMNQTDSYRMPSFRKTVEPKVVKSEGLCNKGYYAGNVPLLQYRKIDSRNNEDLEQRIYSKEESKPILTTENQFHDDIINNGCARKVAALGYILKKRFCANEKSDKKENKMKIPRKNVFRREKTKSKMPFEQTLNTVQSDGEEGPEQHQDQYTSKSQETRITNSEYKSSMAANGHHRTEGDFNTSSLHKNDNSASPKVFTLLKKHCHSPFHADSNQSKRVTIWQTSNQAERWSLDDPDIFNAEGSSQASLKTSLYEPKYYSTEPNGRAIPNTPWKARYSLYGPVFQRKQKHNTNKT